MALSALQARIARLALRLPEAEGFVLAGGGAMLAHGLVDRPTQDLDLFAVEPARLEPFAAAITRALQTAGSPSDTTSPSCWISQCRKIPASTRPCSPARWASQRPARTNESPLLGW